MRGNTLEEFIDDILASGGPEKEFIFRNKYYFLESTCKENDCVQLHIDEYDQQETDEPKYIKTYSFNEKNLAECTNQFETAKIFEGLTIYEAEPEIEVLFV